MSLLSVEEAFRLVIDSVVPSTPARLPLPECLGLTCAEPVLSPADSPPFDKALMDGYAVRAVDTRADDVILDVLETVTAGEVPTQSLTAGTATKIMTGSPLPEHSDAVVRIEDCEEHDSRVTLRCGVLQAGANMLPQGDSIRSGTPLLTAGHVLNPMTLGAAAELGVSSLSVRRRPRVGILSTGNELVEFDQETGPGQIRNSNQLMLAAQLSAMNATPVPLGIARDDADELGEKIAAGLECDALLLSGGVSAGVKDLVPAALTNAGVRQVFHKLALKPGKPLWFGVRDADESGSGAAFVFGLPGNPVSSLVCCELFVRTALRAWAGTTPVRKPTREATLRLVRARESHLARGGRTTYYPARISPTGTDLECRLADWKGSADLCGLRECNGLAIFPAQPQEYRDGDTLEVVLFDTE